MINYALLGVVSDHDLSNVENAKFKYPCCNYYIVLKVGIKYLNLIYELPSVIKVTQICNIGVVILDTNALE